MRAKGILLFSAISIGLLSGGLTGCGFYHEKNPGDPNTIQSGHVSWNDVSTQVLQPRCALCHSLGGAGFNSSDYNSVVLKIDQVEQRALFRQSMPPDSPLTPYEYKLLQTWVSDGTPYNAP